MPRLEALQSLKEAQPINISDAELLKNVAEQQRMQEEEASRQASEGEEGSEEASESTSKILGMPKPVAIGLGVLILAVGGYFVYTKFIKK